MGSNKQYLDKNPTFLKIVEILRETPSITTAEMHKRFAEYAAGSISAYMSAARKKIASERSVKIFPEVVAATQTKSRVIRRPAKAAQPVVTSEPEDIIGTPTQDDGFSARLKWVKDSTLIRLAEAEGRRARLIDELEALEESMRTLRNEVALVDVMASQPSIAEGLILELSC